MQQTGEAEKITLTDDEIVTDLSGKDQNPSVDPDSSDFPDGNDVKAE